MDRREFLGNSVAAGFALATLPIASWAVSTSTVELDAGMVRIPTTDGEIPAYRAQPKRKGALPVIIVVHEIFGVHEYVQDVCRRFAKEGYFAIAPDLYSRFEDVKQITDISSIVSRVVSRVSQEQVWSDLDAVVAWIRNSAGQANSVRLGTTGFCWGGNAVWTYAAHNPKVHAGVAWYGRLSSTMGPTAAKVKTPIELASKLTVPVLGLYGGKDEGIPASDIQKMREELKRGKSRSEIILYPEAGHGFHADYRSSYDEHAAKDGWNKALSWLRRHGV